MKALQNKPEQNTSTSPTVNRIAVSLEERIAKGVYKPGQWLPTERALADEFQVSRIVVRSAIKEVERRNLVICSSRCRPLARNTRVETPASTPSVAKVRRTLALWIWPNPTWPGSMMIAKGIRRSLDHDDFRLILESAMGDTTDDLLRSEDRFLRRISDDRDMEGVMLWYLGAEVNRPALQALRDANIPMVFLDRRPPAGFDADYVGVDNMRAAEHAVKHLINMGHRSIAHVTNLDTASTIAERLAGYTRALEKAHIEYHPEFVVHDTGSQPDDIDSCVSIVAPLFDRPNPPTAIFAVNDEVALRVVAAIKQLGLRIPEDIAVAGFDGIRRWTPESAFLTTVYQPFERMGEQAVDLLLERIESGPEGSYKHILLDAPLHIGSSSRKTQEEPTGAGTISAIGR